jgi:ABC-type multidrug transport system fused ATPase/permease subunit
VNDAVKLAGRPSLLAWMRPYLVPHKNQLALLALLLMMEVVLGVLAPWPLAWVLDYAIGGRALPAEIAGWLSAVPFDGRVALLVVLVLVGVAVNLTNQLVTLQATHVQVTT